MDLAEHKVSGQDDLQRQDRPSGCGPGPAARTGASPPGRWSIIPAGVAILALDEQNNVSLVRQFRYPFGKLLLELPAGPSWTTGRRRTPWWGPSGS